MNVTCTLCPKACALEEGDWGNCQARSNRAGCIVEPGYGRPGAVHVDPLEKKPLYHFYPGESVLSIGTAGCNLHCQNCQNATLSQTHADTLRAYTLFPQEVPDVANEEACRHVAYTYAEPLVCYAYTKACCEASRAAGLSNILVTAGYINEQPLRELLRYVDAANVDLKAMDEAFYRKYCHATLDPVLRTLRVMHEMHIHLEITQLLIPTLNDTPEMIQKLCAWIVRFLGPEIPLHFSRFFPQHQLRQLPATPLETLLHARDLARHAGMQFVYVGNVMHPGLADTACPHCQHPLLTRQGYAVHADAAFQSGTCRICGSTLYGRWR